MNREQRRALEKAERNMSPAERKMSEQIMMLHDITSLKHI